LSRHATDPIDLHEERHPIVRLAPDFKESLVHRLVRVDANGRRAAGRDGAVEGGAVDAAVRDGFNYKPSANLAFAPS